MDVIAKLDELIDLVENARAMPMSASCILNRSEMLGILGELKRVVPEEIQHAQLLLADREAVIDEGRHEAERIISEAREHQGSMVSGSAVAQGARSEADRLLADARSQAEALRREAEDYVDAKLANFEVVLTKTLDAVGRGRDRLRGRHPMDELGEHIQAAEAVQMAHLAGPDDPRLFAEPQDQHAGYGEETGEQFPDTGQQYAVASGPFEPESYFDTGYIDTRTFR